MKGRESIAMVTTTGVAQSLLPAQALSQACGRRVQRNDQERVDCCEHAQRQPGGGQGSLEKPATRTDVRSSTASDAHAGPPGPVRRRTWMEGLDPPLPPHPTDESFERRVRARTTATHHGAAALSSHYRVKVVARRKSMMIRLHRSGFSTKNRGRCPGHRDRGLGRLAQEDGVFALFPTSSPTMSRKALGPC